ncbi:MAG: hypothetical protein M1817_000168 [Caeruleum heppii]|nr:MAG: hypothetical protein M1817_000168 [Caeruleum heppii]
MGSSSSKAASKAARSTTRSFPTRVPPTSAASNARPVRPTAGESGAPGPTVYPKPQASGTRDEAINLDARDPDFAASLRSLGAVKPSPTMSHSSVFNYSPQLNPSATGTSSSTATNPQIHPSSQSSSASHHPPIFPDPATNPAIKVVQARDRLAGEAERETIEAGRRGHEGRRFLDVVLIRQILMLRDHKGVEAGEIERRLGLKRGVVGRLGQQGVVADVGN